MTNLNHCFFSDPRDRQHHLTFIVRTSDVFQPLLYPLRNSSKVISLVSVRLHLLFLPKETSTLTRSSPSVYVTLSGFYFMSLIDLFYGSQSSPRPWVSHYLIGNYPTRGKGKVLHPFLRTLTYGPIGFAPTRESLSNRSYYR